jgi:hypothetical protein
MTMFSFANRKFALAISATALLASVSFATSPASAMDRYVGGGMWERAGTGAALPGLGDRPVGGGMFEKAGTGTTPNGDRPVGGGMYERAGTGTTPNGDRPVGGGMYERAGTGTTPNGDRPVGGGMYEKAGTSRSAVPIGRSTVVHTKFDTVQIATKPTITMAARTTVLPVRSPTPAVTPAIHTTVGAVRIVTAPTPVVRIPTITPVIRR